MSEADKKMTGSAYQKRSSLTRKGGDEPEPEGKPTLGRRAQQPMPSRQERMLTALSQLDQARLQKALTQIGPDELALAVLGAPSNVLQHLAAALPEEKAEQFKQYLSMGDDKLPSGVIDGAQGKLLRIASMA